MWSTGLCNSRELSNCGQALMLFLSNCIPTVSEHAVTQGVLSKRKLQHLCT